MERQPFSRLAGSFSDWSEKGFLFPPTTLLILSQKPPCVPESKEKPWLAQGQDLGGGGSHEVSLFTSVYAADEDGGSMFFLSWGKFGIA